MNKTKGGKKVREKIISSSLITIAALLLIPAIALAAISGSGEKFVTNYTLATGNYSKGADTVTFTITVADAAQVPANLGAGSNASVKIYNSSALLHGIVYLSNQTTTGNGTWNKTWSVPDANWASNANLTFNVTDSSGSSEYVIKNFRIDADDPVVVSVSLPTQTIKGRTGMSKTLTADITDNAGIYNCTVDYTSVPSGSSLADTAMTFTSGTAATCRYTFTPDKVGDYTYRIVAYDNVTNTVTGTSYTLRFKLRDEGVPGVTVPMPAGIEMPEQGVFAGITATIGKVPQKIADFFQGMFGGLLSVFSGALSVFGL